MTAVQLNAMNTQLWQTIGAIADSEPLMKRLTRYAQKLLREKEDPTLMTKEEFYAMIERSELAHDRGECTRLRANETVTEMLRRSGYDV